MTAWRASIDFAAAELAGLTEMQCRALAAHRFVLVTDCADPVPLAKHAFAWCEGMAATVAVVLGVNDKIAGDVVAAAFRPEPE